MDETVGRRFLTVLSPKRKKEILKSLGPVTVDRPAFQDLDRSFLCTECFAVTVIGSQCPRCESTALIGLWRFIPMTEKPSATAKVSAAARQRNPDSFCFYRPVSIAS